MDTNTVRNLTGDFCWYFGSNWAIQVGRDVYIWSGPEYCGDNTIYKYPKKVVSIADYKEMTDEVFGSYGRAKGLKHIGSMISEDVKWK
jgi:hypothetical protein